MSKLKRLFLLVVMTVGMNTFLYAQEDRYNHDQCKGFKTYTQGGWGTSCHGNNPGCYLRNNFADAFPTGLTIGCTNKLRLTSYQKVVDFLPSGGTPSRLPNGTKTNPGSSYKNVLAGQLVALTLNVTFDLHDPNFASSSDHLGDLTIGYGPFEGWTVDSFLTVANQVIGGCSNAYSYTVLNSTATAINENFDNGCDGHGFLICKKFKVRLNISDKVECFGGTGSITSAVTGGRAPYTYLWSNGATTPNLTGVPAGTYTLTVTDANGRTTTSTITLTQPSQIIITTSSTNVSCYGDNNGTANAIATGGKYPYTYLWSTGSTNDSISNLGAGTYTVIVTDRKGCSDTASVTITEPPLLVATITSSNLSCNGDSAGTASVSISGGTSPYSILWNNGDTTAVIDNLSAGLYIVTVTDSNGCVDSDSVLISPSGGLILTTISTDVSCFGENNGSASVTVSGGTLPYYILWSNGSTTPGIDSLTAGIYTVTVIDSNGCAAGDSVLISQPDLLTAVASSTDVTCLGNNGTASVAIAGGTLPYSILWSNGETTADIDSLTAGVYTVTVTDSNGCVAGDSVIISPTARLTLTTTSTDVSCFGGNNGSASVVITGGVEPYAILWSNGSTAADIDSLTAGVYTVTVIDSNGCVAGDSVIISQPDLLTAVASSTDVTCLGNNGTASVVITGGTLPYSILWSNGETTADIDSLTAGAYTVTVTDSNGCVAGDSVIISPTAGLTLTTTSTDVSCFGGNNGSASVVITGGVEPYAILWSNGSTAADIDSLTAGVYTVTVTDSNGCVAGDSVLISQPDLLTAVASSTDVTCLGNNGTASVVITGGTLPYSILWSNGETTANIDSLTAGVYTVTVTDSNGCIAGDSVIISQPDPLLLTISSTDVTCSGGNNGTASVAITGGVEPYTILWSNGSTAADIDSLIAGVYTVTVTDSNGCVAGDSVLISQPDLLTAVASSTDVTCLGNDGTASVAIAGGTLPYSILWSNGETTADIDSLTAGVYTVTVTDSNGCVAGDSVIISPTAGLTLTTTSTDVSCFGGNNGSASVVITGGVEPYAILWSNGSTAADIDSLTAGVYTVTVTDSNGCVAGDSVIISQPDLLTAVASSTDVTCLGNNGTASVAIAGGTLPYSILWSNGETTADIDSLTAGVYTVTVTDSNGCVAGDSVIISPTAGLTLTTTSTDVSCLGNDGTASVVITGGTLPYSILWSNGETTANIDSLTAGVYTVTVTDSNGCIAGDSVIISQPDPLLLTISSTDVTCSGGNNGTASVAITGGVEPYTILWSNGSTTADIDSLTAGIYTVTVTDSNGCVASDSVRISQPEGLTVSTSSTNLRCYDDSTGTASVSITGGTLPYSILWSNGETTANIDSLAAGTYGVLVTDVNGCAIAGDSVLLTQPDQIIITLSSTALTCNAGNNGTASVSIVGGVPSYSILWSNGETTPTIDSLAAGIYSVTVMDSIGCPADSAIIIGEPEGIVAKAGGNSASLVALASGTYSIEVLAAQGCDGRTAFAAVSAPSTSDATSSLSAYPNPAIEQSTIEFSANHASYATVDVYSSTTGKLVATVFNGELSAGNTYSILFNTEQLPSGVYIVKMLTGKNIKTQQLVIVK